MDTQKNLQHQEPVLNTKEDIKKDINATPVWKYDVNPQRQSNAGKDRGRKILLVEEKENFFERMIRNSMDENLKLKYLQSKGSKAMRDQGFDVIEPVQKKDMVENILPVAKKDGKWSSSEEKEVKEYKKTFKNADLCTVRELHDMQNYLEEGGHKSFDAFKKDGMDIKDYVESIMKVDITMSVFNDDYLSTHMVELYDYCQKLKEIPKLRQEFPQYFDSLPTEKVMVLEAKASIAGDIENVLFSHMHLHGIHCAMGRDGLTVGLRNEIDSKSFRELSHREDENLYQDALNDLRRRMNSEGAVRTAEIVTQNEAYSSANSIQSVEESISVNQDMYRVFRNEYKTAYGEIKRALSMRDEIIEEQKQLLKEFNNLPEGKERNNFNVAIRHNNRKIFMLSRHTEYYREYIDFLNGNVPTISHTTEEFLKLEEQSGINETIKLLRIAEKVRNQNDEGSLRDWIKDAILEKRSVNGEIPEQDVEEAGRLDQEQKKEENKNQEQEQKEENQNQEQKQTEENQNQDIKEENQNQEQEKNEEVQNREVEKEEEVQNREREKNEENQNQDNNEENQNQENLADNKDLIQEEQQNKEEQQENNAGEEEAYDTIKNRIDGIYREPQEVYDTQKNKIDGIYREQRRIIEEERLRQEEIERQIKEENERRKREKEVRENSRFAKIGKKHNSKNKAAHDKLLMQLLTEEFEKKHANGNGEKVECVPGNLENMQILQGRYRKLVYFGDNKQDYSYIYEEGTDQELIDTIEWLMAYYVREKEIKDRKETEELRPMKMPSYKKSVDVKGGYEKQAQGSNNCWACAGTAIFRHFVMKRDGIRNLNDLKETVNQYNMREYKPKALKDLKKIQAQGLSVDNKLYKDYARNALSYMGKGKTTVGNIYEDADFFMDKDSNFMLNRMLIQIPASYKTIEGIKVAKTEAEKKRDQILIHNQKVAFVKQIKEVLDSGNLVAVLNQKPYAHYRTITGIFGEKVTYLDSSSGTAKFGNIDDIFIKQRTDADPVELTWFSEVPEPEELQTEFSNLTYDEEKEEYGVENLEMESALNVFQTKGISVGKTEEELEDKFGKGVQQISYSSYIPKKVVRTSFKKKKSKK